MDDRRLLLPKSISFADLNQTERCREIISNDLLEPPKRGLPNYFNITPSFTLILPSLDNYPKELEEFIYNRIINFEFKRDLETQKIINWCPGTTSFVPLYTSGDGNCLLHAASLGMWGFQDRSFILRKAIYNAMVGGKENSLYQRWEYWYMEEVRHLHVRYEPQELDHEWERLIRSAYPSSQQGSLDYLEQFHIFVLANVIRRPIVLYSSKKQMSAREGGTLQYIEFHGIYFPLIWHPKDVFKDPLPIVFNNGHFSALSVIDKLKEYMDDVLVVPLIDFLGVELPVRYLLPHESKDDIKRSYLNLFNIPSPPDMYFCSHSISCAKLLPPAKPKYLEPLLSGFIDRCFDYFQNQKRGVDSYDQQPQYANNDTGPCRNPDCKFSGSSAYDGYCSQHYKNVKPQANESNKPLPLCNKGCGRQGFPAFLGMCKECFQNKQNPVIGRSSDNFQDPPPNLSPPRHHQVDQKSDSTKLEPCRTPGCEFYGNASTNNYCSKCFGKSKASKSSQDSSELRPCRTPGCDFFGNAASNYYCSKCRADANIDMPPPKSDAEPPPPNCVQCKEYFAAPELHGYCYACFLKKTKDEAEVQPKKSPVSTEDQRHIAPYRQPMDHSPVNQLSSDHRRSSTASSTAKDCIVCNHNTPLAAENNVCKNHAERVRSFFLSMVTAPPDDHVEQKVICESPGCDSKRFQNGLCKNCYNKYCNYDAPSDQRQNHHMQSHKDNHGQWNPQHKYSGDHQEYSSDRRQEYSRQGYPIDHRQGYPIDHRQGYPIDHQQEYSRQGYPIDHRQEYSSERRQGYPIDHQQEYSSERRQGYPIDHRQEYPGYHGQRPFTDNHGQRYPHDRGQEYSGDHEQRAFTDVQQKHDNMYRQGNYDPPKKPVPLPRTRSSNSRV